MHDGRSPHARANSPERHPDSLRRLDAGVAERVLGYQWVEWNHALLAGAPLDRPGRCLGSPDSPLAPLRHAADDTTAVASDPYREVPPFSTNLDAACDAAVRCGLFARAGASLSQGADGDWIVRFRQDAGPDSVSAPTAAIALCRAALAFALTRRDHPFALER